MNIHQGATSIVKRKRVENDMEKFTAAAVCYNGDIKLFTTEGKRNPCKCGSSYYHIIASRESILGICNACDKAVYEIKKEDVKSTLKEQKWKELNKPVYYYVD